MNRPVAAATATYNPHLLAREDLVASFIGRRDLFELLVDDLRRGASQHHLLVGSRGSGKTTLLLRLAVAIEDDALLAKQMIPLRFPEEQYNVARPEDFWLNCMDALIDALEARGDQKSKRALEAAVTAIEQLSEDERSEAALSALTSWAKRARRSLVLLVDNLDLILARLRDSQWALRQVLSEDNRLVLIGATSAFLDDAIEYESPLYDFFNVHELGALPEAEAREVVAQLATAAGLTHVRAVLDGDPGRFKALYVLTGGMPRMLALLAGVLTAENAPVEGDLERMLDQLTPYYKARFDELPAQSQIVVDAVALHWHPITAASCAEKTRLDLNLISAQLARLVKQGVLTKVSLEGASKLGFQLTERFFNIWYLMRASRRVRQKLAWFVEFLRLLYGEAELSRRAQKLLDEAPEAADDPARLLALASAVSDEALRRRLESRAVRILVEQGRPEPIRDLLDLEGEDSHLLPVLSRVQTINELKKLIQGAETTTARTQAERILQDPATPLQSKIARIILILLKGPSATKRRTTRSIAHLGPRLKTAIDRGEVPTLHDLSRRNEVVAMLGLTNGDERSACIILIHACVNKSPELPEIAEYYLRSVPEGETHVILTTAAVILNDEWTTGKILARTILQHVHIESHLARLMFLFRSCFLSGHAQDAADLIAEAGLTERLLPIYEALRVSASHSHLSRLAPEVRTPVTEILEFLRKPMSSTTPKENPRTDHQTPPQKRIAAPRKRRRRGR